MVVQLNEKEGVVLDYMYVSIDIERDCYVTLSLSFCLSLHAHYFDSYLLLLLLLLLQRIRAKISSAD